ncbi:thiamine phosphate synthase [Candidatus Woesearchaeota archaeon]|nr:thiamine phosphate synthase [Candidatus Woesearchaeota archaeon]
MEFDFPARLYCITDTEFCALPLYDQVQRMLEGGARIIQLRAKNISPEDLESEALRLRHLTRDHHATFIINDYPELCEKVDADGVHLGQNDLCSRTFHEIREIIGGRILGVSCSEMKHALAAKEGGADYLGVGPIYGTVTKGDAGPPVGIGLVREIHSAVGLPIVAIGGIDYSNMSCVLEAGASSVAMISAILNAPDISFQIRKYLELIG